MHPKTLDGVGPPQHLASEQHVGDLDREGVRRAEPLIPLHQEGRRLALPPDRLERAAQAPERRGLERVREDQQVDVGDPGSILAASRGTIEDGGAARAELRGQAVEHRCHDPADRSFHQNLPPAPPPLNPPPPPNPPKPPPPPPPPKPPKPPPPKPPPPHPPPQNVERPRRRPSGPTIARLIRARMSAMTKSPPNTNTSNTGGSPTRFSASGSRRRAPAVREESVTPIPFAISAASAPTPASRPAPYSPRLK